MTNHPKLPYAENDNKYQHYAKVSDNGLTVCTRGSIHDDFPYNGWPVEMAREYAAYILALANQVEKNNPKVQELTEELSELEKDGVNDRSWEDIAIELVRKGYRKIS